MIRTILDVGQAFSDRRGTDFNRDMKDTLKFIRNTVDDYKPMLDTVKNVVKIFA